MSDTILYGALSFVEGRNGLLGPGQIHPCKTADEARKTAEDRVTTGRAKGAAAFLRRGGGEFDEGESITIATYGTVPPGVSDALPF